MYHITSVANFSEDKITDPSHLKLNYLYYLKIVISDIVAYHVKLSLSKKAFKSFICTWPFMVVWGLALKENVG